MLKGTNLEDAKIHNLRIVFETIRRFGPLSRADVARRTELTPQTISNIVAQLLGRDFVAETGRKQGKRGPSSAQLEFNPRGGFAIGLDLDREHLTGILVDLNGVKLEQVRVPLDFPSPDKALALMAEVAEALLETANVPRERVWGVGVGFPGPLQITRDQTVRSVVNPDFFPGWKNVPVVDELAQKLRLSVYLENNATAAAIGESFYGAGRQIASFFYVFLGYGLGGGVILDKQPFRGFQGNAGELGFLPLLHHGEPERLGRLFHPPTLFERLAAGGVLVATTRDFESILAADHPALLGWLDDAAEALAPALINVEYLFDTEAFIFGGTWPASILDALVSRLEPLMAPLRIEQKSYQPPLIRAQAGEDAAALGVATLPIHAILTPHSLALKKGSQSFPDKSPWLEGGRSDGPHSASY